MRALLTILFLLAVGSPVQSHAQERQCTQMGCVDGLTLSVDPAYRWRPGAYRFEITMDETRVTCTGKLPFSACEEQLHCSDPNVMITQSGCALPTEGHGYGDIFFPHAPNRVSVRIFRDDRTIARQDFAPHYRTSQPNGEGCGPVCRQESLPLTLIP